MVPVRLLTLKAMQSPKWKQAIKEAQKSCSSQLDELALERALEIIKTNFPLAAVPSIFTGPDRCEITWSNGETLITFGGSESKPVAFSLTRGSRISGKKTVIPVSVVALRPPLEKKATEKSTNSI